MELISIYNSLHKGKTLREHAAKAVGGLAVHYEIALEQVIEDAQQYAKSQHIDDAFPYNPNSFDVLLTMGVGNEKVISFLEYTMKNDWGIPRWEAIGVLCKLNDASADKIIDNLIQGQYPPKSLTHQDDLRQIRWCRKNIR